MESTDRPFVLGLDLGVQSVGWAIIDIDQEGHPCGIRRCGVRCFDSGVGSETEISSGKDESQNIKRRQARMQRRQLWRRGRRLKKLFHILQKAGLLPPGEARTPEQRHELLKALDAELTRTYLPEHDRVAGHLLPYRLRALALDQALPAFALGRALFHLGQRRGFLSNRKSVEKDPDEASTVKAAIGELATAITASGARTLGEHFSRLDAEDQRIRKRWTSRQMYRDEFEAIWAAQSPHQSLLDAAFQDKISAAIFQQRPLKSQEGLIGVCELEPNCRRAPRASLEAQRFRYLQRVNDLEIACPNGEIWALCDPRHAALRSALIDLLESHAELEFKTLASKLGLKKPKGADVGYDFNLAAGGEKRLKGNVTASRLRKVLGKDFESFSGEQLAGIVDDLINYEQKGPLAQRLASRYGIAAETAVLLADVRLEDSYASLSREAMRKLLPELERGIRFATVRERVYGQHAGRNALHDFLPPVVCAVPQLRNPVVCRGLTELRKVVNSVIRSYGKPATIRVELARDLKRPRAVREKMTKQIRDNEKSRDQARGEILAQQELGINAPKRSDILKVLLAKECNWECPYTGKTISMQTLLGPSPQFDIEHIIPFSRSLDNSFTNKTLCYHEENRSEKGRKTPQERYGQNDARWAEIIGRVKRFRGTAAHTKLRKFQQKELDGDFTARQLQDTRYMSRLASEYVGLLYGGPIDAMGRRRVQVSAGAVTAFLRDEWGLNAILSDGGYEKNRDDHRHHAVDAIAIALTDGSTIKMLADSAELAANRGSRLFSPVEPPWSRFLHDAGTAVGSINVSYRVNRRVSGALHEETNYSKPQLCRGENGKDIEYRHVRKPLQNMSANEVENIVDDTIRSLVQAKLKQIGGEPKKVFADPGNHPYLTSGDGRRVFIHKARLRKPVAVVPLGKGPATRYAAPGSNHHMEIFAILDKDGSEKDWQAETISLFEAARRVRTGTPLTRRDHGPGKQFRFSLSGGEFVEMEMEPGYRKLYRVTVISGNQVEFRLHSDARPITILKKVQGARVRCSPGKLRKALARKVALDPLGNILPAND
jgi:CRISPR-associated endonuclease Csn1